MIWWVLVFSPVQAASFITNNYDDNSLGRGLSASFIAALILAGSWYHRFITSADCTRCLFMQLLALGGAFLAWGGSFFLAYFIVQRTLVRLASWLPLKPQGDLSHHQLLLRIQDTCSYFAVVSALLAVVFVFPFSKTLAAGAFVLILTRVAAGLVWFFCPSQGYTKRLKYTLAAVGIHLLGCIIAYRVGLSLVSGLWQYARSWYFV